jgi:hypothetical protein
MTSKTANSRRATQLRVCVASDTDHLSRHLLGRPVILIELILDVAVSTLNSQGILKAKHYAFDSVCRQAFQNLNILVLLFSPLLTA